MDKIQIYNTLIFNQDSILIMGSDGLWDVLSNYDVYEMTKKLIEDEQSAKINDNLCHNLAKGLVIKARGEKSTGGFWQMASNWSDTTPNNNQMASGDDITCLALPIAKVTQFLK